MPLTIRPVAPCISVIKIRLLLYFAGIVPVVAHTYTVELTSKFERIVFKYNMCYGDSLRYVH